VHVLALAMPFFAMQIIFSPATNALGQPSIYVRTSMINALIMAGGFAVGVRWGTAGLVAAWIAGAPLMLLSTVLISRRAIGVTGRQLARAVWPSALAALVMAGIVLGLEAQLASLAAPLELAILVASGAAIYLGLLWRFDTAALGDIYTFVTKRTLPGLRA